MNPISILGCGWLGFPLGQFLLKHGYTIKGSTTRGSRLPELSEAGIQPFHLKIEENLIGNGWDSFLDSELLILNIPPGRKQPDLADAHPTQIKLLLDKIVNSSIQKLIFISSTGVYGNQLDPVTEDTPTNPIRNSGKALVQVEKMLQGLENIETTILRMAGLVGGNRKPGRFLSGKVNVPNGNAPVNMVHRDDCIQIIYQIIQQSKWGFIFNVCADQHPTRKDFYTFQAQKEGLIPPTFLENSSKGNGKLISNQKVRRALDYSFLMPDPMAF